MAEQVFTKLYYQIGEVASILGESVSLVRFWTDNFPKWVKPKRTQNKNNRLYRPEDIRTLQLIHYLVKEQRMTLEGAARRIEENREGLDKKMEIVNKLKQIRASLEEVRKEL